MSKYQSIAWGLAEEYHKGQRYGKHPYTYHLSQVCEGSRRAATKKIKHSLVLDMACAVAILHDILEDTECTKSDLIYAGLPLAIVNSVCILTKSQDKDYEEYIDDVLSDKMALLVKREDTMRNLTQSQHEGNAKRIRKYSKQLALLYPEDSKGE